MPTNELVIAALTAINASIEAVKSEFDKVASQGPAEATAQGLSAFETKLLELSKKMAALEAARSLQRAIVAADMGGKVRDFIAGLRGKYRNVAWRTVVVTFLGGRRVAIAAPYYAKTCGRALAKGLYPHLVLFGIFTKATPALASYVAKYAVALSSFEEARVMLAEQNVSLDVKTVRLIAKDFAQRARLGQRLAAERGGEAPLSGAPGRNLVVLSADGGRIRVRRKKRGRKAKGTKRSPYHADWREPKLVIVYVINAEGRLDKSVPPLIDATLAGPDRAFELMAFYLRRLRITAETEIAFIADGAHWIWDRVAGLLKHLRALHVKIVELLDFYHVAQHLGEIARLKAGWTDRQRRSWSHKLASWLKTGRHDDALAEVKRVTRGARHALMRRERGYFARNAHRLDFAAMKKRRRPIGSGAVESAIRRVINLRLKGPGIIWLEATANEMLLLRSFYKAGRWTEVEAWATCPQVVDAATESCN